MLHRSNSSARLTYQRLLILTAVALLALLHPIYSECLPPTFTNTPPTGINKNHCSAYRFDFDAVDGDNHPAANPISFSTDVGTIDSLTGQLTVPALPSCGLTLVTVTASNACGRSTEYFFRINWTGSAPMISNLPKQAVEVAPTRTFQWDFNSVDPDPCDNAVWEVSAIGPVVNQPTINNFGLLSWLPDDSERGLISKFFLRVTDACGASAADTFALKVLDKVPLVITLEKTNNSTQGMFEYVGITKESGDFALAGFDLLIAYDSPKLLAQSAYPGNALSRCGWEYFTYRHMDVRDCEEPCNLRLIRIVAMADMNNGASHPSCWAIDDGEEIAGIRFFVSADPHYECEGGIIRFVWQDCGDNAFSTQTGDTLLISRRVFDFENSDLWIHSDNELTDSICDFGELDYGGACSDCDEVFESRYQAVRETVFRNGFVNLVCDPSIDAPGDLNLNGISYEIADASLYAQYFQEGLSAFDPNLIYRNEQISQSDANNDSLRLTVADLLYLIRVIIGDALPFPKLHPFHATVKITDFGPEISVSSTEPIGGVYLVYDIEDDYTVTNLTDMEMDYGEHDGQLHVLIWPGVSQSMNNFIPAGSSKLLRVTGATLADAQVSDYDGNMLRVERLHNPLPSSFALQQNYPNPFNAVTRINLEIPVESDWTLEIFNINGQIVERFAGRGKGIIPVDWNSVEHPSGVYLYRMNAGTFTDTKKMILLK